MPELPDVEVFRRYLGRTALHRRIRSVSVENRKVLKDVSERTLARHLKGRRLEETRRHGKFLFARLDSGPEWLVLHFGMTGFLKYFRRRESAPEHPRVVLGLDDGYRLAYDSQRMLGDVQLTKDVDAFCVEHGLGPDALSLDAEGFAEQVGGRRGAVKSALMNQSAVAGIGNVYSDEILFQARVHPDTSVASLEDRDLRDLHRATRKVLEGAIHCRADPQRVPRSWLLPHRYEGGSCPRCGGRLERIPAAGRHAWICPRCQRKSS